MIAKHTNMPIFDAANNAGFTGIPSTHGYGSDSVMCTTMRRIASCAAGKIPTIPTPTSPAESRCPLIFALPPTVPAVATADKEAAVRGDRAPSTDELLPGVWLSARVLSPRISGLLNAGAAAVTAARLREYSCKEQELFSNTVAERHKSHRQGRGKRDQNGTLRVYILTYHRGCVHCTVHAPGVVGPAPYVRPTKRRDCPRILSNPPLLSSAVPAPSQLYGCSLFGYT